MTRSPTTLEKVICATGKLILVISATYSATTAHASPTQFELRCRGDETDLRTRAARPYSTTIKIDLVTGKWCWKDCTQILPIQQVTPDRLVLYYVDHGIVSTSLLTLDRHKNIFRDDETGNHIAIHMAASCVATDFVGFNK